MCSRLSWQVPMSLVLGPQAPGIRDEEKCYLYACFCIRLIPYRPQGVRADAQTDGGGAGNQVPLVHLMASWACSPSWRQPGEDFQGDSVGTRSQAAQLGPYSSAAPRHVCGHPRAASAPG